MRRLRLVSAIVAGLVLVTVAVAAAATPASQPSSLPTSNVTGYDVHGHALPPDPTVLIGATFVVVATGFQPLQHVRIERPGYPSIDHVADGQGTVRFEYHVPHGLPNGDYTISLVALIGATPAQSTPTISVRPGPTDTQYVAANIPPFAVYPFRLDDPGQTASVSASSTSRGSSGGGNGQSGVAVSATTINVGGRPAYTGADVLEPLIVGVAAVLSGVVIAVMARRRRTGEHTA